VSTRGPSGDETWWLPTTSTNALPTWLAAGLEIHTSTRVQSLARRDRAWWLELEGSEPRGPYDVVVLTAPSPQSIALLATLACDASSASALSDEIFSEDDAEPSIALIAREGQKPGRVPDGPLVRLVLHAAVAFSREHLEADADEVSRRLLLALRGRDGLADLRVRFAHAHRWRFARVSRPLGVPCLFDASRGLGVAGDGLLGPRVEAA
jgi:predicted NAD/FAD-dependent oxidoreductase